MCCNALAVYVCVYVCVSLQTIFETLYNIFACRNKNVLISKACVYDGGILVCSDITRHTLHYGAIAMMLKNNFLS